MFKLKKMKKINWLYWTPRVLAILFAAFISIFALDVFGEYKFPLVLVALFMHLIPTFIIIILLLIAWKWEKVGGIIFIILGLLFTLLFRTYEHPLSFLIISGPVFLIGFLFLMSKLKGKKKETKVKKKEKVEAKKESKKAKSGKKKKKG